MPNAVEDTAFNRALERFRASLTKDQREQFAGCNKAEVQKTINEIQNRHGSQRRQKNMRRVSKFVEGMSQLGEVLEIFVNADIFVAFLWGTIKFMLLAANSYLDTLDVLLDTYGEIGEILPGLLNFETLYRQYPPVGKQLENYYCDVLEFNKSALEVFSRPAWQTVFRSTWKTFKTNFGPVLSNFKWHQKLLSEEKITALMSEMQSMKSATEDGLRQLSKDLSFMVIQDQAKILAEKNERWSQQRRILRDELSSPDYFHDQEHSLAILRDSSSGDWIANEATFKSWSDRSSTQSPLIFLNGIPGAELTEAAISTQPFCFLVVDGLDECVRDENAKMSETAKVLEWLRGLISNPCGGQSSNIRIFVSGQRDGVIEERLKESPALQLENMKQHMDDIERYAQEEAREI
ncbi:hypothetical protein E8E14_000024, partial [Neopestalotiopsis sp. 37M]